MKRATSSKMWAKKEKKRKKKDDYNYTQWSTLRLCRTNFWLALMAVYEVTIGGGTVRLSPLPPSRFAVSIYTVAALVLLQCCCSLAFAAAWSSNRSAVHNSLCTIASFCWQTRNETATNCAAVHCCDFAPTTQGRPGLNSQLKFSIYPLVRSRM